MEPPIEKWKFHTVLQPTYGFSGKRNGPVCWRKPITNPLGSLIKVYQQKYCLSAASENPPADKQ